MTEDRALHTLRAYANELANNKRLGGADDMDQVADVLQRVIRERDDLVAIIKGVGTQATRVALSYEKKQ